MKARYKKIIKNSCVVTSVRQDSESQALDKSDMVNVLQQLGFSILSQNKVDLGDNDSNTMSCTSQFQPTFNVERPEKAAEQAECLDSPSDGGGNPLVLGDNEDPSQLMCLSTRSLSIKIRLRSLVLLIARDMLPVINRQTRTFLFIVRRVENRVKSLTKCLGSRTTPGRTESLPMSTVMLDEDYHNASQGNYRQWHDAFDV